MFPSLIPVCIMIQQVSSLFIVVMIFFLRIKRRHSTKPRGDCEQIRNSIHVAIETGLIMLCAVRTIYGFVGDASQLKQLADFIRRYLRVSGRLNESETVRLVKVSGEDNDQIGVQYALLFSYRRDNHVTGDDRQSDSAFLFLILPASL